MEDDSEFDRDSAKPSLGIDVSMNDRASSLHGLTDFVRSHDSKARNERPMN